MKCNRCGYESNEDFSFCPICGVDATQENSFMINPAEDLVLSVVKDKLFLILCILMTAASALSGLLSGSFDIISILITIFLWIAYSNGKKNVVQYNNIRNISGTIYAEYVIVNVLSVLLMVISVIIGFCFSLIDGSFDIVEDVLNEFEEFSHYISATTEQLGQFIGIIIGIVFFVVAVVLLLINILGIKKIHSFVKSVYKSVENGNIVFENAKATRNWLIFFAISEGISAVSDSSAILSSGCSCAAIILTIILINKYFLSTEKQF